MQEAEFAPSGALMLKERELGRAEGFRFAAAPAHSAAVADMREQLAPVLAAHYEREAEQLAAAANSAFALGQDGFIRYRGQVIARLKAGADILRPDFVLLADAEVSAAAREQISARAGRFIAYHFEQAVKPLFDLAGAEALLEKPRFIAQKLVEHLGIVPRHEIASAVKELEQESRAALRRLGVRFGVYHIYVPLLLKPAAAQALTLLWALKNDAQDKAGYGDIVGCLLAGRTSFAAEEQFARPFYRLAGYRLLGKRAVRIDILERCADLIRHATAWSPGGAGRRPEGAYDGRHFTITQAMLSILGAKPEDMEEILKQLGYVAQPVPMAEYQEFLQKAEMRAAGAENLPAAEPVGDWASAAAGGAEVVADSVEAAAENVPAAEPVGPKFARLAAAETVLLWHYQKRAHKRGRPGQRAGERRGGRAERGQSARGAEQGAERRRGHGSAEESGRRSKNADARGEKRGAASFGGKKQERPERRGGHKDAHKNGRRERDSARVRSFGDSRGSKALKPEDSPFAALLALKGKIGK